MRHKSVRSFALAVGVLVLVIGASASPALGAELKVNSGSAEYVGAYSATLSGSVFTPNGELFRAGYEYGTTTAYGTESEAVNIQGKVGQWNWVPIEIEGLQPETTYHYRIGAGAGSQLALGSDVTFTTFSAPRFEAAQYPASLTLEQRASNPMAFVTEGSAVKCTKFGGTGTLAATAKSVTLNPVFSGCHIDGSEFFPTVNANGCTYVLRAGDPETPTAKLDIACPAGKVIEVTHAAPACSFTIPPQSGLPVSLRNEKSTTPESINLDIEASGLSYTVTGDGFLCPYKGTGAKTNGTLIGSQLITAKNSSGTAIYTRVGY